MAVESGGFMVEGVDWLRQQSREIRADRMPGKNVIVGIRSLDVTCLKCEHRWTARQGSRPGQLLPVAGNSQPLECPECGHSGRITVSDLK